MTEHNANQVLWAQSIQFGPLPPKVEGDQIPGTKVPKVDGSCRVWLKNNGSSKIKRKKESTYTYPNPKTLVYVKSERFLGQTGHPY